MASKRLKILHFGDTGVGKSSLIHMLSRGEIPLLPTMCKWSHATKQTR